MDDPSGPDGLAGNECPGVKYWFVQSCFFSAPYVQNVSSRQKKRLFPRLTGQKGYFHVLRRFVLKKTLISTSDVFFLTWK